MLNECSVQSGIGSVPNCDDELLTQALWKGQTCLAIDSIQFGNGTVALLGLTTSKFQPTRAVIQGRSTSLTLLESRTRSPLSGRLFSSLFPFMRIETVYRGNSPYDGQSLSIECGEGGGNGAFGFVAVSDAHTGKLQWMFFGDYNPFCKLIVTGGHLEAFSTSGWCFSFDLEDPTKLCMELREDTLQLQEPLFDSE